MVSTESIGPLMAITQRQESYIQEILDIAEHQPMGPETSGSTNISTCRIRQKPAWSVRN